MPKYRFSMMTFREISFFRSDQIGAPSCLWACYHAFWRDKCKRSVIWRINLCVSTLHLPFCGRSRAWLLRCSCGESSTRVEADDRRSWVVRPLPAAAAPRAPALAPAALDQHRLDHRTWCARVFATAWVRRVMPFSWNHVRKNPVKIRVYPKLPRIHAENKS